MIVTRLRIPLEQAEYSALIAASLAELRNPTDQARIILRQELERLGLLPLKAKVAQTERGKPQMIIEDGLKAKNG